jgi:hypothetical protein
MAIENDAGRFPSLLAFPLPVVVRSADMAAGSVPLFLFSRLMTAPGV